MFERIFKLFRNGRNDEVVIPRAPVVTVAEGEKSVILGYHFAKTGGTSISAHLRNVLGTKGFMSYGPHSNADRLFKGLPQLEEMSDSELEEITSLFGHGVQEEIVFLMPHPKVDLFFVYRDPVSHFMSRLKHRYRMQGSAGIGVTAKSFFEMLPENPVASELVSRFPSFIENPGDLYSNAVQVLQKFRFVFSTMHLDEQINVLNAYLKRDAKMPRKRIYNEQVELAGIDPNEILERNRIDKRIHDELASAWSENRGGLIADSLNVYGFQESSFENLRRNKRESLSRDEVRQRAYSRIAEDLFQTGQLEAAKLHLERNRTLFAAELVRAVCEKDSVYDKDAKKSQSLVFKGEYHLSKGEISAADTAFDEALSLNGCNGLALWGKAKLKVSQHDLDGAHELLQKAVKLAPSHVGMHIHLGNISRQLGRHAEAIEAFKRAWALEPGCEQLTNILPEEWLAEIIGKSS